MENWPLHTASSSRKFAELLLNSCIGDCPNHLKIMGFRTRLECPRRLAYNRIDTLEGCLARPCIASLHGLSQLAGLFSAPPGICRPAAILEPSSQLEAVGHEASCLHRASNVLADSIPKKILSYFLTRCNKIAGLSQLLFLGGCTKLERLALQDRALGLMCGL